jgi:sulfur-oxidizing protein SoxY
VLPELLHRPGRRDLLSRSARLAGLLATLGLLPGIAAANPGWNAAAFNAKSMADALRALGAGAPAESRELSLIGPDIAEDGAVVPIVIAAALPGVQRLLLLLEKNPNTLAAMFEIGDAVEPSIATRVKMSESSTVFAVAMLADGRVLYAARRIEVVLGGCGG